MGVPVLLVCVSLLFGLMRAIGGSPLRHGPPLGLSNEAWVKYSDPKPDAIGLALVWVAVFGIGLGVAAAVWRGTLFDRTITAATALMMAIPVFPLATLAIWVVSVKLGLLPTSGWHGWRSWLLPSLVLALLPLAQVARVLRFEMVEVGEREFVVAARAKGLRRPRVWRTHVLRPASVPVLSMAGPLVGQLVLGLLLVEWIFAIPGIGRYFIAAARARDYPLTLGLTVVLTTAVVPANLLSDLALAAVDPRIREAS